MTVERGVPTPVQLRMWDIVRTTPPGGMALIGYGGAAGGGKTRGLVELGIDLAEDYPGSKILIGRKDYSDLRTTTMEQFDMHCPPSLIVGKNDTEHWRLIRHKDWPPGVMSRIIFRDLKDFLGIAGEEYSAVLIDEAGEVPEKSALMLLSRLRWKLPDVIMKTPQTPATPWGQANRTCSSCSGSGRSTNGLPCGFCEGAGGWGAEGRPLRYVFAAGSNPWPGWFKSWFVDRLLPEESLSLFKGRVYFIPAKAKDNPFLPPDYEARLRAIYPEDWVRRLMDGRWDAFVGQVWPQFSPTIHEWRGRLPEPKEIAKVVGGLDFGGLNPHAHYSAGVCALVTRSNRIIVVDEFEDRGKNIVERQMSWMRQCEERWRPTEGPARSTPIRWVADGAQAWAIEMWRKQGLFKVFPSRKGNGVVEMGIHLVGRRLDTDINGLPGLYYLPTGILKDRGCFKIVRRLQEYRYKDQPDENRPTAREPLEVDDDLADAVRYLVEGVDPFATPGDPAALLRAQLPVMLSSRR